VSWLAIDLSKLGERPAVTPSIGAGGLVYPGKRHLFSGPQESAKTLAAYAVALEEIRKGGLVALIDLEMGQWDARDRLREMGATDGELSGRLVYFEPETEATPETAGTVLGYQPTLAIIDAASGAYDLQGLDDNKRKDVEEWARWWIAPLWKAGVATITIDHVVKNADNRGRYAIGSERKVGGIDVHLGFQPVKHLSRGGEGLYRIVTHKDRPGHLPRPHVGELELSSDVLTHGITWAFNPPSGDGGGSNGWRPTRLMDRVLAEVERPSYEPMARTTLARSISGRYGYVVKAIDCLIEDGRLRLDGKKVVA
jgi:hypothetical protein